MSFSINAYNLYPLLLSISYALPLALLIWLWFGKQLSKKNTKSKLVVTLLLPLLYFLHWSALQQNKGWPSDQTLPTNFELISADILEPNPLKKRQGNIHLWVREISPSDSGTHTPRAFILPYSRALHKELFQAKQRIAEGYTQAGSLYSDTSGQSGASIGGGRKLDFKNMTRRRLPPKL